MFKKIIYLCFIFTTFTALATDVAITVDDLPTHGELPLGVTRIDISTKMLAVLKKHHVPEVYGFINASKYEFEKENMSVLKAWRASDYPLANHTYTHMDLHKNSVEDFEKDILRNESALQELNGAIDWHYFRYPYLREGDSLEKRNAIRLFLKNKNYKIAQVTIDFEDWAWNDPYARCLTAKNFVKINDLKKSYLEDADKKLDQSVAITHFLFKRPVKQILLLHIGAFDAEMLDQLLTHYEKKQVHFIPLSEAVKDEIYQIDPAVAGPWGSELEFQILKSKGLKLKDIGVLPAPSSEDDLSKICN